MSTITFDNSRWPIMYITYSAEMTDEDFKQHFNTLKSFYKPGEMMIGIFDLRNAPPISAAQRKALAEHQKQHAGSGFMKGACYILDKPVIRGILTAVNWIFKPPWPVKFVATPQAAENWVQRQLAKHRSLAS